MKVIQGLEALQPPRPSCVLTIGNFDGVHRAHQKILACARDLAAPAGSPVVVLTFEPHPLTVVAPERVPPRLSALDDKLRLLAGAGADIAVIARSEPALLKLEAEAFIEEVIHARFHPAHIVEGPTFGFGRGRKGTPQLLARLADRYGWQVHIVEPVRLSIDDGPALLVSSSLIRQLLSEGNVAAAAVGLGRPYCLTGEVITGDRRGRTIGFPTANIAPADQLVPGDGVYAGQAEVRAASHACAISIGQKPTFSGQSRHIEAHLLDFDGDIYGQTIRLEFDRRLRDQRAFESADALVRQLTLDVEDVRSRGQSEPRPPALYAQRQGQGSGPSEPRPRGSGPSELQPAPLDAKRQEQGSGAISGQPAVS